MTAPAPIRCAIYTRKSTDEGLEQEFNSLEAQFEACAAYIASQRHEGWRQVAQRYDDGGVSGGTIERPALQRLLAEIDAGRIGMVVVYKIDRLTRSLADFVRLVERLEAKGCSFVSVTQAFNTSSSMGRLTLNVLLSFAQFEREVTAERIRDKIAASKKKGLWVGGGIPIGYDRHPDSQRRELVVNVGEAETVRTLFRLYAELGNLHAVERAANRLGLQPKPVPATSRRPQPGGFTRGQLRYLLTNPTYVGRIRHKKKDWPGLHPPIIDAALWQTVQERIAAARQLPQARPGQPKDRPLRGRLFDEAGQRLVPTLSVRAGRRHHYYSSRRRAGPDGDRTGCSLPTHAAETAIRQIVARHLQSAAERHDLLAAPDAAALPALAARLTALVETSSSSEPDLLFLVSRIDLRPGTAAVQMNGAELARALDLDPEALVPGLLRFDAAFSLHRRGASTRIVTGASAPVSDESLLRALGRARAWARAHRAGTPIADLAREIGRSVPYLRERMVLAFLAPALQVAISEGRHPPDLTLERLLRQGIALDWSAQHRAFGFDAT